MASAANIHQRRARRASQCVSSKRGNSSRNRILTYSQAIVGKSCTKNSIRMSNAASVDEKTQSIQPISIRAAKRRREARAAVVENHRGEQTAQRCTKPNRRFPPTAVRAGRARLKRSPTEHLLPSRKEEKLGSEAAPEFELSHVTSIQSGVRPAWPVGLPVSQSLGRSGF